MHNERGKTMTTEKALINHTLEELQAFNAIVAEGLMYQDATQEKRDEMHNDFLEWVTDGKQGGAVGLLAKYQKV